MNMRQVTLLIFILFIFTSCTAEEPTQAEEIRVQDTVQVEQGVNAVEETQTQTDEVDSEPSPTETTPPIEIVETISPTSGTASPDCLGSEPNEIGLGITERFPETTYEQIMIWFCNGAEFEDILVALQTEKLTDFPAGEMLLMLADDWTWDEIWMVIGLTEEE